MGLVFSKIWSRLFGPNKYKVRVGLPVFVLFPSSPSRPHPFLSSFAHLLSVRRCRPQICMVGLDNAGKTTILFRMHLGQVVETHPTIGSNVETVSHKNVEFQVWDLGGQESIRKVWQNYFVNSQAVILVLDSCDAARFPTVKSELTKLLALESLKDVPVLVFANKQDLPTASSAAQVATALDLVSIKGRTWHIQACSAVDGSGMSEGLDWMVKTLTKAST